MMDRLSPRTIMIIGIVLMFVGACLPFLMVIHALESTFFLNFVSFGASFAGLLLAIIGLALTRGRFKK